MGGPWGPIRVAVRAPDAKLGQNSNPIKSDPMGPFPDLQINFCILFFVYNSRSTTYGGCYVKTCPKTTPHGARKASRSFVRAVAPSCLNISPWGATGTPFTNVFVCIFMNYQVFCSLCSMPAALRNRKKKLSWIISEKSSIYVKSPLK